MRSGKDYWACDVEKRVGEELAPLTKAGKSLERTKSAEASACAIPVGFAIAGWATDLVGAPTVFLVGGACTIALTLIGLSHPAIRNLD